MTQHRTNRTFVSSDISWKSPCWPFGVLLRIVYWVALWTSSVAMAAPGFPLGITSSQRLNLNYVLKTAADGAGAIYLLGGCAGSAGPQCVVKLSADGKSTVWVWHATDSQVGAMAVDPAGGVYLMPIQLTPGQPYVQKLKQDGSGVAWTVPLGSFVWSWGTTPAFIAVDTTGHAYATAPVTVQGESGAEEQAVVARVKADGSGLDYLVNLPGTPSGVAVDGNGSAIVITSTGSGGAVTKLSPDGASQVYSTATPSGFVPLQVAADPAGEAAVTGEDQYRSASLLHFDPQGRVDFSFGVGRVLDLTMDAAGNTFVTMSGDLARAVKDSLAVCGPLAGSSQPSANLLSVFAPDGTLRQSTYLPDVAPFGLAAAPDSALDVMAVPGAGFQPTQGSRTGGLALLRLAPQADVQTVTLACVANSASYQIASVAPGEVVVLYGNGLGPQQGIRTRATLKSPFPTRVENTEVTFDGQPAPLLWVQEGQINAVVPWSLDPGAITNICVSHYGANVGCVSQSVEFTSRAAYTVDGTWAAALNQDGSANTADNPAQPGSVVTIFANGMGTITPAQPDGSLVGMPLPTNTMPAGVARMVSSGPPHYVVYPEVLTVDYMGPAPFELAGLTQINFHVTHAGPLCIWSVSGPNMTCSLYFQVHIAGE